MDNETKARLIQRLTTLEDTQLKTVFSNVLFKIEMIEAAIQDYDKDVNERINQEKSMLREVASELKLEPAQTQSESDDAIQFLIRVSAISPMYVQALENALDELSEQQEALDGGVTAFVVGTFAIAIATAIIRPRIAIETIEETTKTTTEKKTKIVLQAQGVKEIAEVVRAVLPFLH